jgi:uncharacterized membrane protein
MEWLTGSGNPMKLWIPIVLGCLVVLAFVFLYVLNATGPQGDTSFEIVNSVGLAAVLVGVIAAGFVLRRARPPQ